MTYRMVSPAEARRMAKSLLRENRKNRRSWRVIAREDFHDEINYATICRFAINKGTWIPRGQDLLLKLGLLKERKKVKRKTIAEMDNTELLHMCQAEMNRLNGYLKSRGINAIITWKKGQHA